MNKFHLFLVGFSILSVNSLVSAGAINRDFAVSSGIICQSSQSESVSFLIARINLSLQGNDSTTDGAKGVMVVASNDNTRIPGIVLKPYTASAPTIYRDADGSHACVTVNSSKR